MEKGLDELEQKNANLEKLVKDSLKQLEINQQEIATLKAEMKHLSKKDEDKTDQLNSVKDLKKELKAFFSVSGYSKLLRTNSFFKKIFWLICIIPLFGYCMLLVYNNYMDYAEFNVVTQIKINEQATLVFPAVTFCVQDSTMLTSGGPLIQRNVEDYFVSCRFQGRPCSINEFEPIAITLYSCYTFNGRQRTAEYVSSTFGVSTGLMLQFNLSIKDMLVYQVHANDEIPVRAELVNTAQSGKYMRIAMKKTVDKKLPVPYTPCSDSINAETSNLVSEVLEQNITYRKESCYEVCFADYVQQYFPNSSPLERSTLQASFNYTGNCSHLCPVQCQTNVFDVSPNPFELSSSPDLLQMNFFYSEGKITEISQSAKTTVTDLIANTGGVLGLFLELSFLSAYRFIVSLYDIIF